MKQTTTYFFTTKKSAQTQLTYFFKTLNAFRLMFSFFFVIFSITCLTGQNVSVSGAVSGNGSYPNLAAAFATINASVQTGATITVSINASTTETTSAVLNSGVWTSLLISPTGGAMTITGNLAGPLIDLNGADNVKFDGLNSGGNSLTISNTNTSNVNTSTIRYMLDATTNTITNCSILGSSTSSVLGTVCFSVALVSGNSGNVISNCNIGPAGANLPVNGIYSSGNSGVNNSNNTIQNCKIFDYFNPDLPCSGIFLSNFNTSWTISASRFYQTAPRTFTIGSFAPVYNSCLQINSGAAYSIINNVFGYASASATGTYNISGNNGSNVSFLRVIDLSVGTATATSIQGNTITSFQASGQGSGSYLSQLFCGINLAAGSASIGNISPNIFGGTSGIDLIKTIGGINKGYLSAINIRNAGGVSLIQNNIFGGLTSVNSFSANGGSLSVINITNGTITIIGNTIGNSTPGNLACGTSSTGLFLSDAAAIAFDGNSGSMSVISNTIQNLVCYGNHGRSSIRGISTVGYVPSSRSYTIGSNLIQNLLMNASNRDDLNGFIPSAVGVELNTSTNSSVLNNTVTGIRTIGTASVSGYVAGMWITGWNGGRVVGNSVSNITNAQGATTSTNSSVASGILLSGSGISSSSISVYNNFVNLGVSNSDNTIYTGVHVMNFYAGNPVNSWNIYHNTINIEGTVSSGFQPSFGFMRGNFGLSTSTMSVNFKNNLVTNNRTGGFGSHYAIGNDYGASSTSSVGWITGASNYNILNTTNSLTVGYWAANLTFANWQTTSGCDANSYSGVPITYVNSTTNNLHLNTGTTPSYAESRAVIISTITTDIDGQARPGPTGSVNGGAILPDIGADEVDAVPFDVTPPVITYTNLSTVCSSSDRTVSAIITDFVGVPATGTNVPRIYFKKNSNTYFSSSGSLISGTTYSGTWNFTISMAAMGGIANGDVISYFIAAQDIASTINTGANPSVALVAAGVNSITSPPTISTQTITAQLIPTISAVSGSICSGNPFVIIPSGANTYTITGGSFTVTPGSTTNYSISGTSNFGCVGANTAVATVSVYITPTVAVASGTLCNGASYAINPTGASTYTISGGNFTISPAVTTSYSITGTSSVGCVSSNTAVSVVSVSPRPTISVTSGSICSGNNFVILPSGASTYTFSGGSSTVNPNTTTSYSVSGTSSVGCISSNTAVSIVSVSPSPTLVVNSGSICSGNIFTINPTGASTYIYSSGSATVNPNITTSYSVTGTSSVGCISSNTAVSTVSVSPSPTLSVNSGSICAGNSFTILPTGAATYSVSGGSSTVNPGTTTSYSVTGTSSVGCAASNTVLSTITVISLPTLSVQSTNSLICEGETATLSVSGAISYSWNNGSTLNLITVSPTLNTSYTVTGVNLNGCAKTEVFSQNVNPCASINQLNSFDNQLLIYPNPNNGEFTIDSSIDSEIIILNAIGQVVLIQHLNAGSNKIDLNEQANGVYFLKLEGQVKLVIKE